VINYEANLDPSFDNSFHPLSQSDGVNQVWSPFRHHFSFSNVAEEAKELERGRLRAQQTQDMLFKLGCSNRNSESDSEDDRIDFLKPEHLK
jgi:hypothetical protein